MRAGVVCCLLLIGLRAEEPIHRPRILESKPHAVDAFTQGLLMEGGRWLESTGQYGKSELREVEVETGKVLRRDKLEDRFFGEGLAMIGDRLYQLTWREGVCRVIDRKTFQEIRQFRYAGEGWGLTSDGKHLFLSDGSSIIRVMDPETFREVRRFAVRATSGPVRGLNELEWVEGELWANIFPTARIVRFSPDTGEVLGFLDLSHLPLPADRRRGMDVLNGIARDPRDGSIWITGKLWPVLYRIEWPPAPSE